MKNKNENKSSKDKHNFLKPIYQFKEKHPLVGIISTAVLGVISFVVGICGLIFFGDNIWLYVISFIVFVVLTVINVLFQCSDHIYDNYNPNEHEEEKTKLLNEQNKLRQDLDFQIRLDNNVQDVCEVKLNTLRNFVADIQSGHEEIPKIIDNPDNQLRNLTTAINKTFARLLGQDDLNIRNNDINVHILYKFRDTVDDSWHYTESSSDYEYDNLDELSKQESLFRKALKENPYICFANSKQESLSRNEYIPCPHDSYKDGKLCGSIFYYKIPITSSHEHKIIDAVITVYTCRQKFTESEDKESLKTVIFNIDTIITEFKSRIQIELILLYISHLYNLKHQLNP